MDPTVAARFDALERAINALVAQRAVDPVAVPVAAVAQPAVAQPAPVADARDTEIQSLRDQLHRAMSAPVRRGLSIGHLPVGAAPIETELSTLTEAASADPRARGLVSIIRSRGFSARRSEADGAGKVTKADCESDLRAMLGAAGEDGLLGGGAAASWQ